MSWLMDQRGYVIRFVINIIKSYEIYRKATEKLLLALTGLTLFLFRTTFV